MHSLRNFLLILIAVAPLASGCEERAPGATYNGNGNTNGNGNGNTSNCTDTDGPTIVIEDPLAGSLPNVVVSEDQISVQCRVSTNMDPYVSNSVVIEIEDEDGTIYDAMEVNRGSGLFEAVTPLDLEDAPNGPLIVRCFATDTEARCNFAETNTFLDLGPAITVQSPATDETVTGQTLDVQFSIAQDLAGVGDTGATLASCELTIANNEIDALVGAACLGSHSYDIDFEDTAVFSSNITDGEYEMRVSATNTRGVTREDVRTVTVDRTGPTINITSPTHGSLAVGLVNIAATVTDTGSGVATNGVAFYVDEGVALQPMTKTGTSTYTGSFDSNGFSTIVTQLNIHVVAIDNAGNEAVADRRVIVDQKPPVISLDPPPIREGKFDEGVLLCSRLFDPLGWDTPKDGRVVGNAVEFRVRSQDRFNDIIGGLGVVSLGAGNDATSFKLYLKSMDDSRTLIQKSDAAQPFCNTINPAFKNLNSNGSSGIPGIYIERLVAFSNTGSSYYPGDPDVADATCQDIGPDGNGDPIWVNCDWNAQRNDSFFSSFSYLAADDNSYFDLFDGCSLGSDTEAPEPVCGFTGTSPLTRVIPEFSGGPAIFGVQQRVAEECVGAAYDVNFDFTDDGWYCAAVLGRDNAGNENVSEPIRVCFSRFEVEDLPPGHPCADPPPAISNCILNSCNAETFLDEDNLGYNFFISE